MRIVLYLLFLGFLIFSCGKNETVSESALFERSLSEEDVKKLPKYVGTLDTIKKRGVLRILLPDQKDAGLPRDGRPLTFERDLAVALASELGVKPELLAVKEYNRLIPLLEAGYVDIVVASLTITAKQGKRVAFSRPIRMTKEILIGQESLKDSIKEPKDLSGRTVRVRPSSSYHGTLLRLQEKGIDVHIDSADEDLHILELLHEVARGETRLTISDHLLAENEVEDNTDVTALFELTEFRPLAWALPGQSKDLLKKVNAFIVEHKLSAGRETQYKEDFPGLEKRSVLRVGTRNNATTYWLYRGKEVGFEYELCRAFAKSMGLRLEMHVAPDWQIMFRWLQEGRIDMIAAGLTITESRKKLFNFSIPYYYTREILVGDSIPESKNRTHLLGRLPIHVRMNSSYYETLKSLAEDSGYGIDIQPVEENMETEEILHFVDHGEFKATVADEHIVSMYVKGEGNVSVLCTLSQERPLGWAFRKDQPILKKKADTFLSKGKYRQRGLHYNMLVNRYFKGKQAARRASIRRRSDKEGVLSLYDKYFKQEAGSSGFDWRMVAAQSYQESKFNPQARSWAGAYGLMQIMPLTAKDLSIPHWKAPSDNVRAGVIYMQQILERFSPRIPYSERYLFTLASYNAGYGHVIDARKLAKRMGWDHDRWEGNVEKAMLLLMRPEYARESKFGYCRGSEAVTYVKNIQRLYHHYKQVIP